MEQDYTESFGRYLFSKRSPQMSMSELGRRLDISPGYVCDLEHGRKYPPSNDIVERIAEVLSLDDSERELFLDLAGKGRREVSADLPEYIMYSDVGDTVRLALRTAKNSHASVEDWLRFVDEMLAKQKTEQLAIR